MPSNGDHEDAEPAARAQSFKLTLTILALFVGITLYAQLPASLVPRSLSSRSEAYAAVWPQKWDFFANDANLDVTTAYRVQGGTELVPALAPQFSAQNNWGLGMTSSVQFDEVVALEAEVPAASWVTCEDTSAADCRSRARVSRLTNDFQPAEVCGDLVFVRTPSADATAARSVLGPYRGAVARAEISCAR